MPMRGIRDIPWGLAKDNVKGPESAHSSKAEPRWLDTVPSQ